MQRRAMLAGLVAAVAGGLGLGDAPKDETVAAAPSGPVGAWVCVDPKVDEHGGVSIAIAYRDGREWQIAREVESDGSGGLMGWVDAAG